ncbi:MAG: hypothetical protein R3C10_26995 [Pirellulales bacterium]
MPGRSGLESGRPPIGPCLGFPSRHCLSGVATIAGERNPNPLLRPGAILLAALALSIGWGIRGNYGHETGAMFPGAITAIVVCLLSGREDWRERVAYFACFGALGWAFGGSISYMQVIACSHSGSEPNQLYGFFGLFLIGFLWASLGGGATALPAVLDRRSLTDMFKPLTLLLGVWTILYFTWPWLESFVENNDDSMMRQGHPLYWFDADWFEVSCVLAGVLLFDLLDRRFGKLPELVLLVLLGAAVGYLVQFALSAPDTRSWLHDVLVRYYGYGDPALNVDMQTEFITNWPNFVFEQWRHLGVGLGAIAGAAVYFASFGKFRCGSSLFLHMALGWWISFLLFPVILGLRLTPPRGDNWAGVLGVFVGAMVYLYRRRLFAVATTSVICGIIGGIGFSGIACLRLLLVAPGNPNLDDDPAVVERWAHWQSANWHSFLEQSYGLVNGIAVVLAMAYLIRRVGPLNDSAPRRRWTEIVAVTLALPIVAYVNIIKNIDDWRQLFPETMRVPLIEDWMLAPWLGRWEMSPWAWFSFFYAIASVALVLLMIRHVRKPLAIVPENWLGRGQLLFFFILWTFVIANFGKSIGYFGEGRLLTEGVITINAVIATILILTVPRSDPTFDATRSKQAGLGGFVAALATTLLVAAVTIYGETRAVRRVYGDHFAGHGGYHLRFGDEASWKTQPILKHERHR